MPEGSYGHYQVRSQDLERLRQRCAGLLDEIHFQVWKHKFAGALSPEFEVGKTGFVTLFELKGRKRDWWRTIWGFFSKYGKPPTVFRAHILCRGFVKDGRREVHLKISVAPLNERNVGSPRIPKDGPTFCEETGTDRLAFDWFRFVAGSLHSDSMI